MSRETKSFLKLSGGASIPLSEIDTKAIQSQGPGGQNVHKVATALQLSFDVSRSSLPEPAKRRLLNGIDQRITKEGVLIIRSQEYRSQEANRQTALKRLAEVLKSSLVSSKTRRPTRPSRASKEKRLRSKTIRSRAKSLRGRLRGE
ncbi:MAG: aminoacyl-tRNA hydrolase [Opitutales bacterium]|nr:aminoacyl-tRNA hydrolase [Opitutales bacterium]